jgi:TonB family protein
MKKFVKNNFFMSRFFKVLGVYFCLNLIYFPTNFAQSSMRYNGEKVNWLDKNGNKVGIWHIFSKSGSYALGVMVDDNRMENIEYFYNGGVFARQLNDSIFELEENKEWVRFTLRRVLRTAEDSLKFANHGENIDPSFYPQEFVRGDGTVFDRAKGDLFLEAMIFEPVFYRGIFEYFSRNIRPVRNLPNEGKVYVDFVITSNGEVKQAQIAATENFNLNEEALRVIRGMPRWQPQFVQGRFVPSIMTQAIVFQ